MGGAQVDAERAEAASQLRLRGVREREPPAAEPLPPLVMPRTLIERGGLLRQRERESGSISAQPPPLLTDARTLSRSVAIGCALGTSVGTSVGILRIGGG